MKMGIGELESSNKNTSEGIIGEIWDNWDGISDNLARGNII